MGLLNKARKIRDNLIYNIMESYIEVEENVQDSSDETPKDSDSF